MGNLTQLYSMEEASQHNAMDDCWIVVDGKVYDVTSYLDDHPGGDEIILAVTGKDATDEFEDAGHSKDARELLQTYCIGELDPTSPVTLSEDPPIDYMQKALNLTKQYWLVPFTIVGISVIVGFLFLKKKQHN